MKRSLLLIATGIILIVLSFLTACSGGKDPTATNPASAPTTAPVKDGAVIVALPGSSFVMGSASGEADAPPHTVTLAPFEIYKTEVTNSMYAACVTAGACTPIQPIPGTPAEDSRDPANASMPALGVDWNMASAYCAWAGGRLPTEAEWEYAATGGTEQAYPWGGDLPVCEKANYLGCLDPAAPISAGSLPDGASPLGVLDMAGNAWEWVHDWYSADAYTQDSLVGPVSGAMKVVRGGGYDSDIHLLAARERHAGNPYFAYADVGFRCARSDTPLALPADYAATDPALHVVPGTGVSVGLVDPGGTLSGPTDPGIPGGIPGPSAIALNFDKMQCPDTAGMLHYSGRITTSGSLTAVNLDLGGSPFTCAPVAAGGLLQCTGAVPPDDGKPAYEGELCLTLAGETAPRCFELAAAKPIGCEGVFAPSNFTASAGCGTGGVVPVNLTYDPDIHWTSITVPAGNPPDCHALGAGAMLCMVENVTHDGPYTFTLGGTYFDAAYSWTPQVWLDADCGSGTPGTPANPAGWYWTCGSYGSPQLNIQHPAAADGSGGALGDIQFNSDLLTCSPSAAGFSTCGLDPALAGTDGALSICIDGFCEDALVAVPSCPADDDLYLSTSLKCEVSGSGLYEFTAIIEPNEPMAMVTLNDAGISCDLFWLGYVKCEDMPGTPGDPAVFKVTQEDGDVYTFNKTFPDCFGGTTAGAQVEWLCENDGTILRLANLPSPLAGATFDGEALDCTMEPGGTSALCNNIPGNPGMPYPLRLSYADGSMHTLYSTRAECSMDGPIYIMGVAQCEPAPGGGYVMDKTIETFSLRSFTSVEINGDTSACTFSGNTGVCEDVPILPGETTYRQAACLDNGWCSDYDWFYPTCQEVAEDEDCGWEVTGSSCENNSMVFRLNYNCMNERVSNKSVAASDGSQEYECVTNTITERTATCFGWRPTIVPYDLTIAYRLTGDTVTRYATIEREAWAAELPYCEESEQVIPTAEPAGPVPTTAPTVNCSSYTANLSCYQAGCKWVCSPAGCFAGGTCTNP